jgi:Coenzyme PQQ synthesis protein D (PqqD)
MGRSFTINNPHVVHETIDGETILIHLGSGTYYSLDGVAAEAWGMLISGVSDSELLGIIEARYEAEAGQVRESVGSLVDEMLQEGLLIPAPAAAPSAPTAVAPATAVPVEGSRPGGPFVAPVLHKYTDMQEFMLVDPIHDVDAEAGWPHVKAG